MSEIKIDKKTVYELFSEKRADFSFQTTSGPTRGKKPNAKPYGMT